MGITCMLACMRSTCGWYEFDWRMCWIPKGGQPPPPNRPWAICLSVWYEDWSALSTIPVSDTERRHKRDVGRAERRGFITKRVKNLQRGVKIDNLPGSVAMSFLQKNTCKFFIGNEKFHPIIHRQMRFIVHFVATKTYLCFNAKHIYLLVRNGQYWPPGMQTGTKSIVIEILSMSTNMGGNRSFTMMLEFQWR